jgi:hypothetical protein
MKPSGTGKMEVRYHTSTSCIIKATKKHITVTFDIHLMKIFEKVGLTIAIRKRWLGL